MDTNGHWIVFVTFIGIGGNILKGIILLPEDYDKPLNCGDRIHLAKDRGKATHPLNFSFFNC